MTVKICVLPGDGVGPEIAKETVRMLKSLPIDFEFIYGDIGYDSYLKSGSSLPDETIEKIRLSDATLFVAVTTPPNIPNYSSPILRLRQELQLFANIRPIRSIPHPDFREGIDIIIFRENTEGLYSRSERFEDDGNRAITERIITRKGSERIIKAAFEYAKKNNRKKVTLVHKANVLRATCGLFLKVGQEISQEYPEIEFNDMIVDACAMQIIKDPTQFDVIVTTNMFGDILSDEASMLVGGLGLAASGNVGKDSAVFEPVHGSAPKYVGENKINPFATFIASAMMLENIGKNKEADMIRDAVNKAISKRQVTKDLGGTLSTSEVTDYVIGCLR